MRILLSAFACEPGQGSEAGIGWGIAWSLARTHTVHVVTTPRHREKIERFLGEQPCPALSFSYFDLDQSVLRWVRTSSLWQMYYHVWQLRLARWVQPVVTAFNPDVTHHVTYGRYWSPSSLWKVDRPFFWGPVGGGDTTPDAFVASYSPRGRRMERLRRAARSLGEHDPSVTATARHAAFAFPTTAETASRMTELGVKKYTISSHAALATEELPSKAKPRPAGPPRFCCVGNLLHWKGFHLAIETFAAAKLANSELILVGEGPEKKYLQELAQRLSVADRVTFAGRIPRPDVLAVMASSTALLHPSLHDSGGFVCLEAMANERPVVCLNLAGPGMMVTPETGFSIPATTPARAIPELTAALRTLAGDDALCAAMGEAGRLRVRDHFTWEAKAQLYESAYQEILTGTRPKPFVA